jgi:hypothetical protein
VSGTYCDAGACGCDPGFCASRGAGGFCDRLTAVSCVDRNGCAVEVARETCSVACDAGACDCPTNACSAAPAGAASTCAGDDAVACADSGDCRVEAGRTACEFGCSDGACVPEVCGGLGEPCCGSACDAGGLCAEGNCVSAPATQLVTRYESVCDPRQHWNATGTCFPGPAATSACLCADRITNSGCAQQTCWSAQSTFTAYATQPPSADFVALYHCFDGGANSYQLGSACARPGFPHVLGFVAVRARGGASRAIYRCRLSDTGVLVDELLTADAADCSADGRVLVPGETGDAWFWAQ